MGEKQINRVLNYKTIAVDSTDYLLYKNGNLYFSKDHGNTIDFIAPIPMVRKKSALSKIRLSTRLFRLEPRATCCLGAGEFLISYSGKVYRVDVNKKTVNEELSFRQRMNNPLSFTRVTNLHGFFDGIYFGEYFSNNYREAVCIYSRTDLGWNKVYEFPPKTIYHIHGIVPDYDRGCLYILTGDADNESAIWEARDDFSSVKPLLFGSQQYRACVAFPYDNGLIYATDTSRQQNYLYYAKEKNGRWENQIITKMPGPCIYGTKINGDFYFATSVEPDDTLSPTRFRYTYKLGKGVNDRFTHIMKFYSGGKTLEIFKAKKDILPMMLFQFGNCLFPDMKYNDELIFCPISVKDYDGKTLILK